MPEGPSGAAEPARSPSPGGEAGQDAFSHSGEFCRRVLESIEDFALVATDPEGLIVGWSPGAERIFGYRREEILGRSSALLFTPEDRVRSTPERELETARSQGKAVDERWHVRKDGSCFWGSGVTTALRNAEGRLIGFTKLSRDFTEQKLATDALRREAARRADIIALQRELTVEDREPEELMGLVSERSQALTGASGAVIALLEQDELVYQVASGGTLAHVGTRFGLEQCPGGLSIRGSQPVKMDDTEADARAEAEVMRRRGIRSLVVAPLFHQRRAIGALEVHSHAPNAFSDADVEHLSLLAAFLASLVVRTAARQRLQAVLEALPVGVTIADRSGQLLEANPATYAIWGAEMPLSETPEFYGAFKGWWPGTGRRVEAHEWGMARAIHNGEISGPEEVEIETFTGERKAILNSSRPIRDAAGRITGAVTVNLDITEQKRARELALKLAREEAARTEAEAARQRTEAILESITDAFVAVDRDWRVTYLNQRAAQSLGRPRESFLGKDLCTEIPQLAGSTFEVAGRRAMATREPAHLEDFFAPLHAWLEVHIYPHEEGLACYARDISRRKRAQEELRLAEEFQHFLSEASRALAGTLEPQALLDGLARLVVPRLADCCIAYGVDRDGKARPAAVAHRSRDSRALLERLRGLPAEEEGPLGLSRVLRLGEPERVGEVTEAWMRSVSPSAAHLGLLRELAFTSVMMVPLCSGERIRGALVLASEQRTRRFGPADLMLAEELANRAGLAIENARLYQESQRATRARDEVLAVVSHDLRNPLSTISMSGKLLLEKTPPECERERRQLAIIQRSAERMNRLIQDLLDVARVEAGHLSVERRREAAGPLVHDALELQRTLAEEKGVRLEASVAPSLPDVEVDRGRILQVLQNLMGNALRFTPQGGRISLGAWPGEGEVCFAVRDTGPGIAEEAIPHLFEPFWQGQTRREGGAGLGLAIVKGIVEAHGGRIWVESRVGQGTAFIFSVPILAGAAPEAPPLTH